MPHFKKKKKAYNEIGSENKANLFNNSIYTSKKEIIPNSLSGILYTVCRSWIALHGGSSWLPYRVVKYNLSGWI
jgi:hypothetical protein